MSAYVLVEIEVLDQERYETYKQLAPSTIAVYGGRYLARGRMQDIMGITAGVRQVGRHRSHADHGPSQKPADAWALFVGRARVSASVGWAPTPCPSAR